MHYRCFALPPGGRYLHKFRIGVCREGSLNLNLFKDKGRKLIPFLRPKPYSRGIEALREDLNNGYQRTAKHKFLYNQDNRFVTIFSFSLAFILADRNYIRYKKGPKMILFLRTENLKSHALSRGT